MGSALSLYGDNLSVVILDDRMWDGKTLAKTMERLENQQTEKAPMQVILMSTFKPRGRARAKWNYVEIDSKSYDEEDEEIKIQTPISINENPFDEAGESNG